MRKSTCLTFNLDNPLDKTVWDILQCEHEGSMKNMIATALIAQYGDKETIENTLCKNGLTQEDVIRIVDVRLEKFIKNGDISNKQLIEPIQTKEERPQDTVKDENISKALDFIGGL